MTGEQLFWDLATPLLTHSAVTRSTLMGFPCLRLPGRFFASLQQQQDRRAQRRLAILRHAEERPAT